MRKYTLDEILEKYFDGTKRRLAESLGVSYPSISIWGDQIPPRRAKQVADLCSLKIEQLPVGWEE